MPENSTRKNCIIYCRVSSAKQAQQGESLEQQEAICRNIAERNNFPVLKVFSEQYTGREDERPAIEDIFSYIKSSPKKVNVLIFRAIDRFTRNGTFGYEHLIQQLAKLDVTVLDSNGIIQPSKNTLEHRGVSYSWSVIRPSEITELVMAQQGKVEVNQILTRMIDAEIGLVREGYKVRQADDGYLNQKVFVNNGGKKVIQVPDSERADFFIKMFELRASGAYSDTQIVERINAMGYLSRPQKRWSADKTRIVGTRGGLPLTVKQFQKIIQRPIYCGVNAEKWLPRPIRTQYAGLVSIQTFNEANRGKIYVKENIDGTLELLKDYNLRYLKRTKDNPEFPFKSVILCPLCKKPFLGSSPKGKSGNSFPTYHCCRNHKYYGVNKTEFEKKLSGFVNRLTYSNDAYIRSFEATLKNKFREKEKELGGFAIKSGEVVLELEAQKQQALDAFLRTDNAIIQAEIEKKINNLQERINRAQGERNSMEIEENDVNSFVSFVNELMEHPEEYLVKQKNPTLLKSLYGLVFEEFPTYEEILNGTPKLSLPYKLKDDFEENKSLSVTLRGIEPRFKA